MPRLPVVSGKEAVQAFRRDGWQIARRVGSHRLRLELLQKGIPRDVAAAAIAAAFEEAPEALRCLEAGRRRLPALLRAGVPRAAPRLRDYRVRRGYPMAEVMRTVAALIGAISDGGTRSDGDAPPD